MICVAGAVDSFGEAAEVVLKKLAGLRVSESTVQRTSEAVGHDIGTRLAAGETFGAAEPWAWHRDAEGKTCAYVSLDLTGLGMQGPRRRGGRGPDDRGGDGLQPGAGGQGPVGPAAGTCAAVPGAVRGRSGGAGVVGRAVAAARRPRWAWIGPSAGSPCSDAGAGVEDWLRVNFGRVEAVILDFYHVTEHLGDLGRALYPG